MPPTHHSAAHAHFAEESHGAHQQAPLPPHRRAISDELFKSFDLDGNGAVSLSELSQVLEACKQRRKEGKEGAPVDAALEKQRSKWMSQLKSQIRQVHEQIKRKQSSTSFALKGSSGGGSMAGQIHFQGNCSTGDGDPSLDPDAFAEFIRVYGGKYCEEDFAIFTNELRASVDDAYENTMGNKKKKLIWELFRLMDVNHDSQIDMKELQLLLSIESKKDKKSIAKWKAILSQRRMDARRASFKQGDVRSASSPSLLRGDLSHGSGGGGGGSSPGLKRRQSHFAMGVDGVMTIKDEEVEGESDDDDESPPMSLKDFQDFLGDFYGDDMEKIESRSNMVKDAIRETNRRYLHEMKVDEIMNDILEDLLRERPHDVLEGIHRSVNRLRRLGNFPVKLYRSWSTTSHPFARSPVPDDMEESTELPAAAATV